MPPFVLPSRPQNKPDDPSAYKHYECINKKSPLRDFNGELLFISALGTDELRRFEIVQE